MATHDDPIVLALQRFVGFLNPTGLLVAPKTLSSVGAILPSDAGGVPARIESALATLPGKKSNEQLTGVPDLWTLLRGVLDWPLDRVNGAPGGPTLPLDWELVVPEGGGDRLAPLAALVAAGSDRPWLIAMSVANGTSLDEAPDHGSGWKASPQSRLDRLQRHLKAPVGLLFNGTELRLCYAPHGETSGHGTWTLADLTEPSARPLAAGLHLLLGRERVFLQIPPRQLVDLLAASRKAQNTVSTELETQVLDALWLLLDGFQAADGHAKGTLVGPGSGVPAQEIYEGLLKVVMRLVFLLFAEDQDLLPRGVVFRSGYSLRQLFARLERDEGMHPDTMEDRYGAWATLLSLFRLVHDGGGTGENHLPARAGELFNPWRHPFLEGARAEGDHPIGALFEAPRVSDGCILKVLQKLLVVGGERLSYRTLDVEQIGSVYQGMMGYDIERVAGHALVLPGQVQVVVDADELLAENAKKRIETLKTAGLDPTPAVTKVIQAAKTPAELLAAFPERKKQKPARVLAPGSLVLQPGYERRRTGSHYTPRELTSPIVRRTLEPVLAAFGDRPTPDQILSLKVCDPAMGSGAFLVEACRQLAEALLAAWDAHGLRPTIPSDEDPLLHARRVVAQRCLYGVDRNRFAVPLAKLSLWLATLARDHAFTFLDHALKHGDALVGLDEEQITRFQWEPLPTVAGPLFRAAKTSQLRDVSTIREKIGSASDENDAMKHESFRLAEQQLEDPRRRGDLIVAAFFASTKPKAREEQRRVNRSLAEGTTDGAVATAARAALGALRGGKHPVTPFHWHVEFPEVFLRDRGGFDAIVGNPPFSGKNGIIEANRAGYLDWIKMIHEGAHGNADLVTHFFRRAFGLLRMGGCFGLIATNTVAQGDTRESGLAKLVCDQDATIYAATKRYKWPGLAAVVVSVVHVVKGPFAGQRVLNGVAVDRISTFLLALGPDESPRKLIENAGTSFIGSYVCGMGFTFDDDNIKRGSSPLALMHELTARDSRNGERIFAYIGGDEMLNDPTHSHRRYVINLSDLSESSARQWPALMAIIEERVKPSRVSLPPTNTWNRDIAARWWQFGAERAELKLATRSISRVLMHPNISTHVAFAFVPSTTIVAAPHVVFAISTDAAFATLQSRVHEVWARFLGSSMKDDLRYTPSDCFETFPLPPEWRTNPTLEESGQRYYAYRSDLMKRTEKGLTKTYNRFHDRKEFSTDIIELRRLHDELDRAVLHAYGWDDVDTTCDFYPDRPVDEEDAKVPWRYRWPDEVRDEVLARLLALNQERPGTGAARSAADDEDAGDDDEAA